LRPAVAIAWSSGPSRGLPHGSAIAANWSLPCIFGKSFRWTRFDSERIRRFVSVRIVRPLFSGNSMVRAIPSKSHPRISFCVSHVPSSTSFFTETAGPIELLVISGGGKWKSCWEGHRGPIYVHHDVLHRLWCHDVVSVKTFPVQYLELFPLPRRKMVEIRPSPSRGLRG
jgi:hypothetical protein